MSERTSYDPGTPSWIELSGTPDIDGSAKFYAELFGWEMPELPNSAELGGYRRAKLNGKDVGGVSPKMQDEQPCVWSTYISVESADATLGKVREAGGNVMFGPDDVMDLGKLGVFVDPTGAVCGVWEPGTFAGAEIVNENGSWGWNELNTRDVPAAREFYTAVFDWTVDEMDMGERTYYMWKAGEEMRGGMIDPSGMAPDEAPNHWLIYFTVADADATVETAKANGGAVMVEPMDIAVGRMAVIQDPQGAVFAIMALNDEMRSEAP
jgi:predicted enzyme related to lactoylglutathione lyase